MHSMSGWQSVISAASNRAGHGWGLCSDDTPLRYMRASGVLEAGGGPHFVFYGGAWAQHRHDSFAHDSEPSGFFCILFISGE